MDTKIIAVAFLGGVAVFTACIAIMSMFYDASMKKKKLTVRDEKDWLFHNFHEKFYDACYSKLPEGKMLGIDVPEYEHLCGIMKLPVETKKIIAMRMEGMLLFLLSIGVSYILTSVPLLSMFSLVLGFSALTILSFMPYSKLHNAVKARLYQIEDTLPRYLSLLSKALDLPVEQAIEITSKSFPCVLSEDLLECCHSIRFGAGGWQESLTKLAKVYKLDSFNGFVMDIIQAYSQGTDIKEAVERKAYALEQNRLYVVEQEDARTKTLVFIPMMVFKIVPLMALMMIPMIPSIIGM